MSVINQMLRDLDARDASDQERAGLPPRLRTLPPAARAGKRPWGLLVLGIAIGAAVAGVVFSLLPGDDRVAPMPPAVPPAPTFAPAPATVIDDGAMKLSTVIRNAEPAVPPAEAARASAPPPAKPAAADKPLVAHVPERPKLSAVAGKAVSTPAPAPASASASASARPSGPPAAATKPVAPLAEAGPEAQIDKRPKGGQAREMADAEYRRGLQAAKQGDPGAAVVAFQRALERDPGFAKARQALLATLVGGRQWAEARQVAEAGLALDPTQSGWAVILARLQFEQGEADAAIGTLERHAAHAGGDADYQGLFAYLLQRQQRPAEAAERFRAGLALRPGEGRWWFGLGLALENSGKPAEAKEAYARAKEIGNLPADMTAVIEQKLR